MRQPAFSEFVGWQHFERARAAGRGVLLVTIHLGNWEFGAPLLKMRGVDLHVITQAEPDPRLTDLRQEARARLQIATVVIGDNPFGFVDVMRRLEAGSTVALLMDRPPRNSAVNVELFGSSLNASISAAELARATGCALLPVYLPRTETGYAAHILPPIEYDRAIIDSRMARQELTQRVMTAFVPAIQTYMTQWYHFVPIWNRDKGMNTLN
jgi:KDO2-lipid IV(A) lauroyltransferase